MYELSGIISCVGLVVISNIENKPKNGLGVHILDSTDRNAHFIYPNFNEKGEEMKKTISDMISTWDNLKIIFYKNSRQDDTYHPGTLEIIRQLRLWFTSILEGKSFEFREIDEGSRVVFSINDF